MKKASTATLFRIVVIIVIIGAMWLTLSQEKDAHSFIPKESHISKERSDIPFFKEPKSSEQIPAEEAPVPRKSSNDCAPAGCSLELCVSAQEAESTFTSCEFKPEYACYQGARCGRQSDGQCGWTQTDKLKKCLANPGATSSDADAVY